MFCANAVRFLSNRQRPVYKAAHPRALEGKEKRAASLLAYDKKAWTARSLFLGWLLLCSVPEIKTYLSSKGLPFKSDKAPGHPKPQEFNSKGLLAFEYNVSDSASVSAVIGTFRAQSHMVLMEGLSVPQKRPWQRDRHGSLEGRHH